ncbi:unnamed protein product [Arctogadus glacialis]
MLVGVKGREDSVSLKVGMFRQSIQTQTVNCYSLAVCVCLLSLFFCCVFPMISIMIPTVGPQIQIMDMYFITLWSNWEVYLFPVVSRSPASGTWITLLVLSCLSAWRVLGITWHPVYVMQAWMYACVCI